MTEPALSRQEQKEQTREALLDAALELSSVEGFAQVSLRQIAKRAGVVPTAFYRHFASMDEVGLALVERSFVSLRSMIRAAQRDPDLLTDLIPKSVDILVEAVQQHRQHFAFVGRERLGGSAVVRAAIDRELELFVSELALTIRPLPNISGWSSEDVLTLSGLFVRNMVYRAEHVLAIPDGRADLVAEVKRKTRRELRMIALGVENWRSA